MKNKDEICAKLEKACKEFNESLGAERFEVLRQAVADREKAVARFPLLKYAALIVVLLVCVFIFRAMLPEKEQVVSERKPEKNKLEKVDFAWDYEQPIDALKSKVTRFKRKVYFSELRNKNSNGFYYRCRTIKKQAGALKNSKKI